MKRVVSDVKLRYSRFVLEKNPTKYWNRYSSKVLFQDSGKILNKQIRNMQIVGE